MTTFQGPAVPDPGEIWSQLWSGFKPGNVAWDVGANCGQTLPWLRRRYRRVVAFEPVQDCWPFLNAHVEAIFQDLGSVQLVGCALSDTTAEVELFAIPEKMATGQLVTAGTKGMEWSGEAGVPYVVQAMSGDALMADHWDWPDFVKIDVEGHEQRVLDGMSNILETRPPEMLIEIHSEELSNSVGATLVQYGYHWDVIRHPHYEPESELWRSHMWYRCLPRR